MQRIQQGKLYRLQDPNYLTKVIKPHGKGFLGYLYKWSSDNGRYEYVKDMEWTEHGATAYHVHPFSNVSHEVSGVFDKYLKGPIANP
jgi:hypothetical protein